LVEIRQTTRRAGARWKPVDIALPDNAAAHGDEAIFYLIVFVRELQFISLKLPLIRVISDNFYLSAAAPFTSLRPGGAPNNLPPNGG
jgi:hypothetical protein